MANPFAASIQTWGLIIQTGVLIVTAALVWWYVRETQQMKQEMVHQNQLQLRPVVVPLIGCDRSIGKYKPHVKLKNIGSSAAFNIKIEALVLDKERKLQHEFEQITALAAKEEREVEYELYSSNRQTHAHSSNSYIDPFTSLGANQTLTISFQDTEGGTYQLQARVYPDQKANGDRPVELGPIRKH